MQSDHMIMGGVTEVDKKGGIILFIYFGIKIPFWGEGRRFFSWKEQWAGPPGGQPTNTPTKWSFNSIDNNE